MLKFEFGADVGNPLLVRKLEFLPGMWKSLNVESFPQFSDQPTLGTLLERAKPTLR